MDCSPPGSSVHEILQARTLERVAISFSRGSSDPGIKPTSPALQVYSLPSEPPGNPHQGICFYLNNRLWEWICKQYPYVSVCQNLHISVFSQLGGIMDTLHTLMEKHTHIRYTHFQHVCRRYLMYFWVPVMSCIVSLLWVVLCPSSKKKKKKGYAEVLIPGALERALFRNRVTADIISLDEVVAD